MRLLQNLTNYKAVQSGGNEYQMVFLFNHENCTDNCVLSVPNKAMDFQNVIVNLRRK